METFIKVLDEVNLQLSSRFAEKNVIFMHQLPLFAPASLLSEDDDSFSADDIRDVYLQHRLNAKILPKN